MIKFIFIALAFCVSLTTSAQIKLPAVSPAIEITQQIGLTTATLSYSRPSLRGRKLFGEEGILVLGKKWRTGANATTKVAFSNDIEINSQKLPKGVYALLTTPQEKAWTFHFYPYEKIPYTEFLDKEAILEFTVASQKTSCATETLSLHFDALTINSANLVLQWGNYRVEVPIKINEHEKILANIEQELSGPSSFDYFQAALYLHETQTDLLLALNYIQKVTQDDAALFFQVYREALILKDLNRKKEAVEAAKRSMELSEKAGNDDLVRLSKQIIESLSE